MAGENLKKAILRITIISVLKKSVKIKHFLHHDCFFEQILHFLTLLFTVLFY